MESEAFDLFRLVLDLEAKWNPRRPTRDEYPELEISQENHSTDENRNKGDLNISRLY